MKFLGDKIQMVRHVMTPTVSFTGAPDFGAPFWGVYGQYTRPDIQGNPMTVDYNYFQHGLFGTPGRGTQSVVSFSLANNLEMKVKSDSDSTGVKKISLIENLSLSQSYNFAADSLNWSNLNTSILLRLTRNFNLNLSATWDPYCYGVSPSGAPVRINRTRLQEHRGWMKLASTGTSFSYTLTQDTFKKKNSDSSTSTKDTSPAQPGDDDDSPKDFAEQAAERRKKNRKNNTDNTDADGYEPWSVPWSLTFNYSLGYGYGDFDFEKMDYRGRWTQNLSLSGNIKPTKNWSFNFSASYDFNAHKIAYMNCSVSRDLHCFVMTASFVPVGPYKSYNFHIAVKSSILKDLKYDKRSSRSNGVTWY